MSDDPKTATGPTDEPKKPVAAAPKPKAKKAPAAKKAVDAADKAPTSQAVPPVLRRPRTKPGDSVAPASSDAPTPAAPQIEAPAPTEAPAAAKAPPAAAAEPPQEAKKVSKLIATEGPAAALARKAAEAKAKQAKEGGAPPEAAPAPSADGPVTVTAAALEAEIEATKSGKSTESGSGRRSRRTRAVRNTDSGPAEGAKAAEAPTGGAGQRPRRERSGGPGSPPRGGRREPGGDRGRRPGPPRGRGDHPAGRDAGRNRDRDAPNPAAGLSAGRRIYRQDVAPHVAAAQAEAERKAAETERKRREKESQDKITLILHPAPKAAMGRKKKKNDRPLTAKEALKAKTAAKTKVEPKATEPSAAAPKALDASWLAADVDSAADALAKAGSAGEALVKAWLEAGNVAAIAAAAHLESLEGGARKAARRALNIFKSRGVDIPKVEPSTSRAPANEVEEVVSMFIPPDATGATFFSISQRQPGGRYHVVDIVVRAGVGIVHANSAKLAGKHIRDWQNRVEKQYGTKPVQVPTDWARHLIAEGRKHNDVSKQLIPLGFDSCQGLLKPLPSEAPNHPLADLIEGELSADAIKSAVTESELLHGEPEFGSWLPDRPALDELLAKVGERVGPDGVKDSAKVDEAIRLEVAAATDRWFTPERRNMLADSMNDCAISVLARRDTAAASNVIAVAHAVRDAGLITSPPSEIPFLLHFFQKAVAYLVRQNQGQLRVPIPARQ